MKLADCISYSCLLEPAVTPHQGRMSHLLYCYHIYCNLHQTVQTVHLSNRLFHDSLGFVQWDSACHALTEHMRLSLLLLSLETVAAVQTPHLHEH